MANALARTRQHLGRGADMARRGMTGEVISAVGKLHIRDRAALRREFAGRTPDEVAEALVRSAVRASGTAGAAFGTWAVLPVLPMMPAEIVAETLAVIGIEVRLVAELHELYGMGVTGSSAHRMGAYLAAWTDRRSAVLVPGSLALTIGSPLRKRVSRSVARRTRRSAVSMGPLLTGAFLGATFNRRETRRVGDAVRESLAASPLARRDWN